MVAKNNLIKEESEVEENIGELKKLKTLLQDDSESVKVEIKGSKPISEIKKGDKIKINGIEYIVDAHCVLIDHGRTKEMAIEIFNPKTDKDYQLRYFSDRIESSVEFYELQEIIFVKQPLKKIEW